jgi:aspartate kinase
LRIKLIPLFGNLHFPDQDGTIITCRTSTGPGACLHPEKKAGLIPSRQMTFLYRIDILSEVFALFRKRRIKVNLIQQSDIDLSFCSTNLKSDWNPGSWNS